MLKRISINRFEKNGVPMLDMRYTENGKHSKHGIYIEESEIPEFINKLESVRKKPSKEEDIMTRMLKAQGF